jgi:hypothetical protein
MIGKLGIEKIYYVDVYQCNTCDGDTRLTGIADPECKSMSEVDCKFCGSVAEIVEQHEYDLDGALVVDEEEPA